MVREQAPLVENGHLSIEDLEECIRYFKRYPTWENTALIPVYKKAIEKRESEMKT